jgi:hypothetical protein
VTAAPARETGPFDRVMMKDGSSFEVRRFELAARMVTIQGLDGRVWTVWSELVDLDATRRANGMSAADLRSPGWTRESQSLDAAPATAAVGPGLPTSAGAAPLSGAANAAPLSREASRIASAVQALTLAEPGAAASATSPVEPVDYDAALARATAQYEAAVRSIAAEQERLERRVKELEHALDEAQRANAASAAGAPGPGLNRTSESVTEGAGPQAVGPLLEELANVRSAYQETLAKAQADYEAATQSAALAQERLEQRVQELELARGAQEDATRQIIRDATSTLGSQINQYVAFGGTFEVGIGRLKAAGLRPESSIEVGTAEADFEVQANDWTLGSLILEYVGTGFDIDTAFMTVGDPQRFAPFGTVGRIILPFGISTGDPVADVLTLEDPLTIDTFEMRDTAVLIGAGFPTRGLTPAAPPMAPPAVRPRALNPLFRSLSRGLGYRPPPTAPQQPVPVTPLPDPPLFNVGFVLYQGDTSAAADGRFNYGATAGFVKKWDCGRAYDEGWHPFSCPFRIEVDVDYNSSIFDSRFLEVEYQPYLRQIGFVPGMASSIKATVGGLSFVGEWNGALERAMFVADSGARVTLRPSAWQVSLAYQFDWNPWVEAIGSQGTYVAFSHSRSEDLAGFTQAGRRIGFVPWQRFSVTAGEWVMDGLRLAIDFSRHRDYPRNRGGSGSDADGVLLMVTYAW